MPSGLLRLEKCLDVTSEEATETSQLGGLCGDRHWQDLGSEM